MPATDFTSLFERIVLTQAAISAREIMDKWLKAKEAAIKKGEPSAPDLDVGNSREEVTEKLFKTFIKYHKAIFKYASQYNKHREFEADKAMVDRVFQVDQLDTKALDNLKVIFKDFVDECYDEHGQRKAGIDDIETAAKAMHKLYETLKKANNEGVEYLVPLRYLRFPAGLMIAQLGSSEKWKGVNDGKGIDFNRGEKPKAGEDLEERFMHAFSGRRDEENEREFKKQNNPSPYIHHHESFIQIEGYKFPCLKFEGRTHLITDSGHLVDMTQEVQRYLITQLQKGGRADNLKIRFTPPAEHSGKPETLHLSQLIQNYTPDADTPNHRAQAEMANASLDRLRKKLGKLKTADTIDGRTVEEGVVQLVSMDIDLLTGLSMKETKKPDGSVEKSEVARLGAFIRKHSAAVRTKVPDDLVAMSDFLALFPKPKDSDDYDAHIDGTLKQLEAIALSENNKDILELLAAAAPHIKTLAPRIKEAVDEHFKGKKTAEELYEKAKGHDEKRKHETPFFGMTVGGVAAGKSNAERIANEECGKDNYVIAGLDMVRSMFDRQAINLATDNHNFDYKNIEQAGKLVRAMVLERGRKQGYHLLLDGSGIPYENRYAPILAAFKGDEHSKFQYKTNVLGFDRTLYVHDPQKRGELDRENPRKALGDAFLYQGIRIGRDLRAVPVKIIANNYASVPEAILQASQDPNVDRFWLIDNNPRKNQEEMKPYILSFTAEISEDELTMLDKRSGADLKDALTSLGNKKINKAMQHERYNPDELPPENWNFKVVAKVGDKYRIEIITDAQRYLGTIEKGLFNMEADGPEALFKLTKPMSFDVEGLFQSDRRSLAVQPDKTLAIEEWFRVPYAIANSLAAKKEPCYEISSASPVMRPINPYGQAVAA